MGNQRKIAVEAVMLAEDVMEHFDNVVKGLSSSLAWYELVANCESYLSKAMTAKEFSEYLQFIFGFKNDRAVVRIKTKSRKRFLDVEKW